MQLDFYHAAGFLSPCIVCINTAHDETIDFHDTLEKCLGKMLLYFSYFYSKHTVVGEPKSRIEQKHIFFAPERYTAGFLYTDSLKRA